MLVFRLLGYQWFAIAAQGVITFAVTVAVARLLSPDLYGVYSIATTAGVFLTVFLDGGFGAVLQRESIKTEVGYGIGQQKLSQYAFGHALAVGALVFTLLMLSPLQHDVLTLAAIFCAFVPMVLMTFLMAVLRGQGRLAKDAQLLLVNRCATAMLILLALGFGFREPWEVLFAQGFASLLLYLWLIRRIQLSPAFFAPMAIYRKVWPFLCVSLMTIVYTRSDILISRILNISRSDVGNYGIACRMIEAILLFAAPIGMLLLRKFHLAELETEKLLRVFGRYVVYAAVVGIGFGVLGVFFSKTLIPVVFGHDYDSAGHLLSILFGGLAFALVNVVLNQAAIAISAERLVVIAISAGAIFNVVLNAVLMPSYGVEAAAWVAVVTQALISMCLGYSLIKWLRCQVQVQDRKAS